MFDKTQGVYVVRQHLATSFNIPEENVQVISPFVGGAFGSSLRPNYYPALTAMAARVIKRPVKVVYTRQQMYVYGTRLSPAYLAESFAWGPKKRKAHWYGTARGD
ncbi:molybdopterin cofactor-binding domain-containing protein [Nostoc sp. 'Peltigera malacea cyanobiont' DB3992]|uniref:molybdopterin cofactor-binding domain-containing protein n=1 Tax=Nostoc sp. 'Peltigera malacea cyanobiont' DB3992 TaxID=1206980 RepID=UPI000C04574B|nr:molybdopterin cofactor-binding domain-containing protein [Nostoc sp. 'Peltigera malacea cyanobiont' DB3992]PHM09704.1 hypothetical protein CK516_12940 [Nostoc sp. 'Peltigera malacea cyanobiont' DB3992]